MLPLPTYTALDLPQNTTLPPVAGTFIETTGPEGSRRIPATAEALGAARSGLSNSRADLALGAPQLRAIAARLYDASESCAIQVVGDSTGVGTDRWVYRLAFDLAAQFPELSIHYLPWAAAADRYDAPTKFVGTGGERRMEARPTHRTRRSPYYVHPDGVLRLEADVAAPDWTPAADMRIGGKMLGLGQRSWDWYIRFDGRMVFRFSEDGTNLTTWNSDILGFADGSRHWIGVTFTPNDGAGNKKITFHTSADGVVWTNLNAITVAGVATLFDSPINYAEIGGVGQSCGEALDIYEVRFRNGVDGPLIAPALPDLWLRNPNSGTQAALVGAPRITIVNASRSGASIINNGAYLADAARLQQMSLDYGQAVAMLSTSHNDGGVGNRAWFDAYAAWLINIRAALPGVGIVGIAQNPQQGTDGARAHASRCLSLLSAAAEHGVGRLNIYELFARSATDIAALVPDGVHPGSVGSQLWADAVRAVVGAELLSP